MEITGKITHVLPERSGVSARSGAQWVVASYVLETVNDRFPRRMMFEVFGADKIQQFNIQVGEMVRVSFDIDARDFTRADGTVTWFNSIRAWNVDRNLEAPAQMAPVAAPEMTPFGAMPQAAPAPAAPMPQAAPAPAAAEAPFVAGGSDDLPF